MSKNIEKLKHVRYLQRSLIYSIKSGVKFQLSKRSEHIKFNERSLELNMSYESSNLSVGDSVYLHGVLEAPWFSDPEDNYSRDSCVKIGEIVAFFELSFNLKGVTCKGVFCVIHPVTGNTSSSPGMFRMAGVDSDKIALYFADALEREEDHELPVVDTLVSVQDSVNL